MDAPVGFPDINLKKYDKAVLAVMFGGLALLTGSAVYGLMLVMPLLLQLAQDTVYFLLMLIAAILLLLFGAEAWMARDAVYYKMKIIARNVRKAVVREDPIGVLDVTIHRFEAKLEDISTSLSEADAARARLQNRIRNKSRQGAPGALDQAEAEEALAVTAQRLAKPDVIVRQHAVAAERWRHTAETLQPMLDNLERMHEALDRARELCAATLDDRKSQKDALAVQLDAMKESQRSVRTFKRFMMSSPELDMMEMSIDEIERQSTEAEAEIDQFLRVINPQLETADLKKSAEAEQAMAKLNAFIAGKQEPKALPAPALAVKDGVLVGDKTRAVR